MAAAPHPRPAGGQSGGTAGPQRTLLGRCTHACAYYAQPRAHAQQLDPLHPSLHALVAMRWTCAVLYFRAIWLNRSIPSNQIRTSTRSTTGSEGRRCRSAASDRLCSAEEEDIRRRDRRKNERRRPAAAVRRSDSILQRRRGEQIILAFGLSMG